MMTLLEKATIIHYHRQRMEDDPQATFSALGYRAEQSQTLRFEVLAGVADLNGSSVLDVGCGYGDLKNFLDSCFHGFSYIGIDQMAEFISVARARYGQRPNCYFCVSDFTTTELPRADYVFASGVLGYRCAEADFYFEMIAKMYHAAGKALAFNMLDVARFPHHELLIGHDPAQVLAYCKTLAPRVELIQGYLEDDFTVLMYKQEKV